MSVIIRRKIIKECEGGVPCSPITTLDNVGGMGNPVPPTENTMGSGDNFGNATTISVQTGPKFKLRRKKKQ